MTKEDLKNYLVEEAEYRREDVEEMDRMELIESWCTWNGLIGWHYDVCDVVFAAHGMKNPHD